MFIKIRDKNYSRSFPLLDANSIITFDILTPGIVNV